MNYNIFTSKVADYNKYMLVIMMFSITSIIVFIGDKFGIIFSQNVSDTQINVYFGLDMFISALEEEIIFRFLPILVVFIFIKNLDSKFYLLLAIVSSIIFGYLHGNYFNILIQGFTGFINFTIFIAKFKETRNILYGLFESTKLHFIFNAFITINKILIIFIVDILFHIKGKSYKGGVLGKSLLL